MNRIVLLLIVAEMFCLSSAFRGFALEPFPLAATVTLAQTNLAAAEIAPTVLKREEYLKVSSGIVNYFEHFQTPDGRIMDPFLHREVQYSTPCYAWAAAGLVDSGRQTNLLESAALALDAALQELAEAKAADGHGDFFTFPAMLAYEHLRDRVRPARRAHWEELLHAIDPARAYRDVLGPRHKDIHNWNIVALSGEFLRHQDGFTGMDFVERNLEAQFPNFTATGQYCDPNTPMAYDHFPRHFLAAILYRGYDGKNREILSDLMDRAAWTSLLMQSPCGELPTGGRSAQHQWNEAMQCVTYEAWAARSQHSSQVLAARAFKRAAHLALQSVQRWVRPSGELWIVKNRFDPAGRHGFESYSSHSQYNLLAASMLTSAWLFAEDSIPEGPCPADVGGFVVSLPEFHKVIANAGGLYVELDTAADPHYNSTGLIRVHKRGVGPLAGPSDSSPGDEHPLAVGIAWSDGDKWQSLAGLGKPRLQNVTVSVHKQEPNSVEFGLRYEIKESKVRAVTETYQLTPQQVRVTAEVEGNGSALRVRFPAFAFDGAQASAITIEGPAAAVRLNGAVENFQVESPEKVTLRRTGQWLSSRNGYLEAIEGEVPGHRVVYSLRPGS